jgi:hypothetical protein
LLNARFNYSPSAITQGRGCEPQRTFASDSTARCANIAGCNDTASMLFACGNAESEHDKLGSEIIFALFVGAVVVVVVIVAVDAAEVCREAITPKTLEHPST